MGQFQVTAGVNFCPTPQPNSAPCLTCPAGFVGCSQQGSMSGTSFGGCAVQGAAIKNVCPVNDPTKNSDLCVWCLSTVNSATICDGINSKVICNGVVYTINGEGALTSTPVSSPTSPTSPTSGSSSSSSCFAGSEMLELESGLLVAMNKIQVGDKVLVASLDGHSTSFSPVMVIPHADNNAKVTFVHLSTVSGRDIKMTAEHLVLAGACTTVTGGYSLSLVQASSVKVGDCLATVSGEDVVSSVSMVAGEGIYTVVPEKNMLLIVNGILASPFAVNHVLANAFYNIHRAVLLSMAPLILAGNSVMMQNAVSVFGELVSSVVNW